MWGINIRPDLAVAVINRMDVLSLLGSGLVALIWLTVGLLTWMAACDLLVQHPTLPGRERWSTERLTVRGERQPQARIFGPRAVRESGREVLASSPSH